MEHVFEASSWSLTLKEYLAAGFTRGFDYVIIITNSVGPKV